jgi:hypothetical protein
VYRRYGVASVKELAVIAKDNPTQIEKKIKNN